MIQIKDNLQPDDDWNNRLLDAGIGPMVQTKERAVTYSKQGGYPRFLKFLDHNNSIVGQLMLGVLPRFTDSSKRKFLKKIPGVKKSIYFWIYGPIIFDPSQTKNVYSSLQNYLLSKKSRVYGTTYPICKFDKSFILNNFKLKEWATSMIDLQKPLDELYENISKHSGRKNIERSEKRGIVVEEINEDNLLDYHTIRHEFKDRIGEDTFDYQITLDWWRLVKPIGYSGFLARKDGRPVGGILFSYFNNIIVEAGIARASEDEKEKLYSQDLIKWKMIEWGHKHKMKFYDLAGYNPFPTTAKEEGIKRYKEKWGGTKFSYWFIRK